MQEQDGVYKLSYKLSVTEITVETAGENMGYIIIISAGSSV